MKMILPGSPSQVPGEMLYYFLVFAFQKWLTGARISARYSEGWTNEAANNAGVCNHAKNGGCALIILLLANGCMEYTFECIPRAAGYRYGYVGLVWASYIHQPDDKVI